MGKRNSQRKSAAAMLDLDDTDSVSSTSTDFMSISGVEEVELEKDSLLDEAVEALFEKRGATRENALSKIVEAFNSNLQHDFVDKKFVTLLHQCLNSIKRGSTKEISLAAHTIGLLALTVGCEDKAHEILEESITPLSQALKSTADSTKTAALVECLAVITFVGQSNLEEAERSMQILWQLVHPKLGFNVVAVKPSAAVISVIASAWSFLLTTADGRRRNPKDWLESITYLSTLMDKDDRSVRIAAGEALALIFQKVGSLNDVNESTREGVTHIQGLRAKIVNQVRNLSVEAGGKGSSKKDLNTQRNMFRDVLEFLEDGYSPETSMKIGSDALSTTTWSELIQLNYLKHFLGSGFVKHMQDNEFLHDVFGFTPKNKLFSNTGQLKSSEKKLYKSPNSVVNKARTQKLNKQRMQSQDRNTGHYAVDMEHDDF